VLFVSAAPTGIIGKDELGDLARDFDVMAAQIELLIHRATPVCC
jgi:hypothetical protein